MKESIKPKDPHTENQTQRNKTSIEVLESSKR